MTNLGNIAWGSGPNITGSIAYEYQRSGADMQYRVQITINTLPYSSSYFGFPIYASIKLDGSSKASATIKNASPSQWSSALVYTSGWLTVSGKSSGTTSLSVNIYSGSGESRDYTYNYSLYVVPAASTMTVPAITLGTAAELKITPAASGLGYKHTITYRFGSASGTVVSSTSSTSISWTPSLDLANQVPNATLGTGTLTLDTYSGSTKIGSRDYSFTANVPSSVKPSVSSAALSDSMGYFATFSAYVQNKSKLKVTITANQSYGSAIKSYTVVVGDKTTTATTNEVTVELPNSGTVSVAVRVVDGRGRVSNDYTTSITVLPYESPKISNVSAVRCQSDGTEDTAGTYVKVTFSGTISPLSNINAATWKVQRRKQSVTTWSTSTVTVADKYNPAGISKILSGIVADSAYVFRILATDTVTGNVYSVEVPVPAGFALFRTNAQLNGLTFGRETVKENTLGVAWDMEVDGELLAKGGSIELNRDGSLANYGGVIDFHFNKSNEDYTSRIIEDLLGRINIQAPNGLSIAGNVLFENGEQTDERVVRFKNTNGTNTHNCSLYGGNPNSDTAIGLWDTKHNRRILAFLDNNNDLKLGNDSCYITSERRLRTLAVSSGAYMNASQTITLSDSVSNQLNGIVVAWSYYSSSSGTGLDYDWNYTFIPKEHVLRHSGAGIDCPLMMYVNGTFTPTVKYIYVSNTTISGNDYNSTGNAKLFVLRYVYGV